MFRQRPNPRNCWTVAYEKVFHLKSQQKAITKQASKSKTTCMATVSNVKSLLQAIEAKLVNF